MKRFLLWICAAALTISSAVAASDGTLKKAGQFNSPYEGLPGLTQKVNKKSSARIKTRPDKGTANPRLKKAASALRGNSLSAIKAPAKAAAFMPDVYGSVVYSADEEMAQPALYQVPTSATGDFALVIDEANAIYGGVAVDGIYYAHYAISYFGYQFPMISAFDLSTGKEIAYWWGDGSEQALDLAYNIKDGKVYGLFMVNEYDDDDELVSSSTWLGTITYPELNDTEGEAKVEYIAELAGDWNALAIDNTGKFYGISMELTTNSAGTISYTKSSYLYTIDPTTGASTKVSKNATGEKPYYFSSATFDLATNRLFWTVATRSYTIIGGAKEDGALCEVNTTTGIATRLVTYANEEEICGLYTPSKPVAEGAPNVATDLKAEFAVGAKTGTFSFTLPTTLFDGTTTASGKLGYKVTVNSTDLIAEGEGNPGETITVNPSFEKSGDKKFGVVVSNAAGESPEVTLSIYVGYAEAATPEAIEIKETATNGVVEINWTPVTTDTNGNTLPEVTYALVSVSGGNIKEVLGQGLTETTFTHVAVEAGALQELVQYAVFAEGEGGMGEPVLSDLIFAGEPYTQFKESFTDGELSHDLLIKKLNGSPSWGIYTEEDINVPSADNDNGLLGYKASYINESSSIITGKINLAGMAAPIFSFYVYTIKDTQIDEVVVYAGEPGTEFAEIYHMPINQISPEVGWHRATVDLAQFAGKTIQLQLAVITKSNVYAFFDKLYVGSQIPKDLAISDITVPEAAKTGEAFTAAVTVINSGTESAAGKVNLYVDGALAGTKETAVLASDASATLLFNVEMSSIATAPLTLYAEVVLEGDGDESNNKSEEVKVTPIASTLPAIKDLTGKANGLTATLTWSEPEIPSDEERGTTGFEDGDSFAKYYGDWTFVDLDGGAIGGIQNTNLPGIVAGKTKASFFVFDHAAGTFSQSLAARTGDKYLAALFNYDGSQCDDWAISPELSGNAQTISFYARSFFASYPESFEVLYSTTDKAIASFKSAGVKVTAAPAEWTEYTAQLPEGAKYFAIHYDAADTFMFMMDDFKFEPDAAPILTGFNIYRDGVKLNAEPLDDTVYTEDLEKGTYSYAVTALYDKGESKASNTAEVTVDDNSGIDAATTGIAIEGADKAIVITGAEGLEVIVSAVDGKTVFAGEATATLTVPVAQGVYVVKAGNTVAKIIVR